MADALQEITIFARVVSTGSLSAAARDLGLSPALVSRRLSGLEARLAHHGDRTPILEERGGDAFVLPAVPDGEPLVPPGLEAFKAGDGPLVLPGTEPATLPFLTREARPPFAGDGTFVLDPDGGLPDGTAHRDWM